MWWGATWLACRGDGRPAPVDAPSARSIDLRTAPMASLVVPPDSLGARPTPDTRIALDRGWTFEAKARNGVREYRQPVPIRPRGLFFFRETPGVGMIDADGERVAYRQTGGQGRGWSYDREVVRLFLPAGDPEPGKESFLLDSPLALGREQRLHRRLAEVESDEEFVRTRIGEGIASRDGLLLPAPASISWDLEVPPAAELSFAPGLVLPELSSGPGSDGAELVVTVTTDGETDIVFQERLPTRDFPTRRVDLSRWTGRTIHLAMETRPGPTTDDDFAFVGAPVVASRVRDPRKVLFVFVDTVRVDHLSLFGYERDTSAAIDHLRDEASVFTNARSIAPWTLPSSRSVLTGRYPDRWRASRTLQSLLSQEGFATGFIAGNIYLTSNFGMDRDFDYHQEDGLFPSAESTTDDALAFLDAQDGRDVFLQVHYMSAHLPYQEPLSYRYKYAGAAPDGLADGFELGDVRRAGAAGNPELQQYIQDRYDNNIRYATDQIERLLERLDDNDVLVLYADHGEEFWDHKGYEHGHTLYDELLRVPLVIRAPGMPVGAFAQEASLLDVAPTVLDVLGLAVPPELDGRSLRRVAEDPALDDRTIAFGWPLYGAERWGVLVGDDKWTTTEGREFLFDVATDPVERVNRLARDHQEGGASYRRQLGDALGREVKVGYRLANTAWKGPHGKSPPLWALCSAPGGFSDAWVGDDPLDNMHASVSPVSPARARELLAAYQVTDHPLAEDAGAVELCWQGDFPGPRELYVVPTRPMAELGGDVRCSAYQGDATGGTRNTLQVPPRQDPGARAPIGRFKFGDTRALSWQYGIAPAPTAETESLDGRDAEADAMLSMLGYVDKDAKDARGRPCVPPEVQLAPMDPAGVPAR